MVIIIIGIIILQLKLHYNFILNFCHNYTDKEGPENYFCSLCWSNGYDNSRDGIELSNRLLTYNKFCLAHDMIDNH